MAAVEVVQRQVDAYNAGNLAEFAATYSDEIQLFRMPSSEPFVSGKGELVELFGTREFNRLTLRVEILNRFVLGNKVIDHERVWGSGGRKIEAVAVYEVSDDLIQRVWFFDAGQIDAVQGKAPSISIREDGQRR